MQGAEQPVQGSETQENAVLQPAPDAEQESPQRLPRAFERWTLLKQIARGGMGEVFLATSLGIEGAERPCVVKIIRREHAADRSFLARFLDEARIQAQLQHPGVAQILEAASDEHGKPYVVVEYVEGRNLGEVRGRAAQLGMRIGWPDAVALGISLAEALTHVHERTDPNGQPLSIVHRDLSPQNVMVGYAGDVKLIDFGTARGENRRCHTIAGIVFAKPGYVAPEVANNTPGGVPADLYAFGIMVWELLLGRRFLTGEAREHLAAVAAGLKVPPPIAEKIGAPAELDAVIARLTATRIADRYASAREATHDLLEVLKGAPSLDDGERGVRTRVARLMQRLYPGEPARSRTEFVALVNTAKVLRQQADAASPSPSPQPAVDPALLPGTRYRLTRELGRGGMGVVFEGVHLDLGRTVAIKLLPREHASSPEFGERFRAEARAIAKLQHDNLVRLYDFGISGDGQPFYAMERLEGESMDMYIEREKQMGWREAFRLGIQACSAVEAAHAAGVVHRDIKPANLFLTRSGALKLLDFGVAKIMRDAEPRDPDLSPSTVGLAGTPDYMAPEQLSGARVDPRTDLYALGVVLYELVTGTLPHRAESTPLLLEMKTQTAPERPTLRAARSGLTRMADETLLRALSRDPADRYQSAAEMRSALELALHDPERRRRQRRRVGFAAVATFAMSIGAISALGATRPDVRERALAFAEPVLQRLHGLRAAGRAETVTLNKVKPAPVLVSTHADEGEGPEVRPESIELAVATGPLQERRKPEPDKLKEAELDDTELRERAGVSPVELETTPEVELEGSEPAPNRDTDSDSDSAAATPAAKIANASAERAKPKAEHKSDKPKSKLDGQIAEARAWMSEGKRIKALNQLRRLGRANPKHARVLEAWSKAAAEMNGWGEAARVARQWASFDSSVEARLHLARMLRALGKREEAVRTLSRLLRDEPRCEPARALLKSFGADAPVALRP